MTILQLPTSSLGLNLRDILPDAQVVGDQDVFFRSCCGKWDECQTDDLFVAVVGSERDGHDYAPQAVQRGALAVVGERLLAVQRPQFIVDDSRNAYGLICNALAGNPSQRMTTIGVSGTDGKTVTSHLIHSILEAAGARAGLSSTVETRFGRQPEPALPADNAPLIAEQLSKMVLGDCTHAVIETSSVALAQRATAGTSFDVAVLTNVRRRNLEYHGSVENYRRAKKRLIQHLKPTGFAILNADEPFSQDLVDEIDVPAITIGIHQKAEITAKLLERNVGCQTFILLAGTDSIPVRTQIIGKQHVYNCLSAAAVALTLGIDLCTIARGLEKATIPGRLERIDCGQQFGVWIDSARSPSQLTTALAAVGRVSEGKLLCVCSTDPGQSAAERKRIGEILERMTERPVITSAQVCKHIDYEPAHQVIDGFSNSATPMVIPDRFKAIEWALANAEPNDAVLVAGCGERPIAVMGEGNWTLSDRDVCQAWLYDRRSIRPNSGSPQIFRMDDYR